MKRIIKHYAVDTFSLYIISQVAQGLIFENGTKTLLLARLGLLATSILAKPVINMLLLPLNLVTFGVFRWISSAVALYIVTLVIPGFRVGGFIFGGFSSAWFDLPPLDLTGVLAYIAYSLLLAILTSVIYWIVK